MPSAADTSSVAETVAQPAADTEQLPPYQALMREQAREKAEADLAGFVELQLELEQQMRVDTWGQTEYDQDMLGLVMDWDIGGVTLSSITGWVDSSDWVEQDFDSATLANNSSACEQQAQPFCNCTIPAA